MQSLFPTAPAELNPDDLAELYAYPADGTWTRAIFVATADGAAQGPDGKSGSISTRADTRLFGLLRSLCDVVLVGAGTARAEGYQPVLEHEVDAALRSALGLTPTPAIAVVSRSLDVDPALLAGAAAPTFLITTRPAHAERALPSGIDPAHVVVAGDESVDLAAALEALAALGLSRVLAEGGPMLLNRLTAAGCLDELCLTLTPVLTGGGAKRITDGPGLPGLERMRLRSVLEEDGTLFLRYLVGRESSHASRLA